MPYIDRVNVDGETYALEPVMDEVIKDSSGSPVTSGAVYDYVDGIAGNVSEVIQPKLLSATLDFFGTVLTTVTAALQTIASYFTSVPTKNSNRFFTAGGAYADKATTPQSESTKNFTAGGAYADKATAPEAGSTKNYTAGGAYADKTDVPEFGNNKCLTSQGAYTYRTDTANASDTRIFTAGGAYTYFANCTTFVNWIEKIFAPKSYTELSHSGYFVD